MSSGRGGPTDLPDLRLAGFATACWLAALVVVYGSVSRGVALIVGGLVVAVGLVAGMSIIRRARCRPPGREDGRWSGRAWWHRSRRFGWIGVALAIGVVCGSAAATAQVAVRDARALADLVDAHAAVTVDLVVRDDPRQIRSAVAGPALWLVTTRLVVVRPADVGSRQPATAADQGIDAAQGSVVSGRFAIGVRLLVLGTSGGWAGLLPGQQIRVDGRLMPPRGGDLTAAVLSTDAEPVPHGRPSLAQRAAGALRAGLQDACAELADEPGGLLPGLVVGDTSRLDAGVEEDFRATGLTHLVAVSGSNVAIIVGFVLLLVRWCRAGPGLAAAACAVALVGFVILARPSPSVVRAGLMGAIALLALATGRQRAALPALATTVAVLVMIDPQLAVDAGFALSVLATGGLLLLAPRWRDALVARGMPQGVADALVIPAAAQFACTPVVAGLSGTVSLVAVPANLLAVPAIAPATVCGVAAAVASVVWPAGAEFVAWVGHWPAWWLVLVARHGAATPAGALPWPDGVAGALSLAALSVAVLLLARHGLTRRLLAVVAVGSVIGALPVRLVAPGWPPAGWVVAVCAVGQGDVVVLPAGPRTAVVVDAGPNPAAADRCLRRLRVRSVSLLVVSHFHADHVAGVAGVLRHRQVGAVATTGWLEPAAGRDAVRLAAARAGVAVGAVPAGWTYRYGPVELVVLGPVEPFVGTRSDPNNNSLMLLATVRGVRILLTGDAEHESQRALLERFGPAGLRADVLKVAHHGSALQEVAFLDAVDPAVAVVPVGAGNRYGHPDPGVLTRLVAGGARVLRTDLDGDLAVVRRDGRLAVSTRPLDATDGGPGR
ncbi:MULTISPECIES: ComEC/Rec2 family competence protein [unclassified Solwaraspora]|uniref:ComEC/Rec2 family competence protein n=1 Tax=unclassified Solwaraspora TaxID=2627926 RepID=UPI00259BE96B|nr:ComEC/Rec2 family competence protein [Solwaraspora sp. WMMA2056]WJK43355.1 ComEC/Rec2 family competence protein [Solwaraspora sp. WMMA2056]